jgi:DNA-binding GntR family transcriptional regulator
MESRLSTATLAEQAYDQLRQEILTCTLLPGQVVSERELAGRYNISKTPMREAFTQACHNGLLQRLPGRGYMVTPITIRDIQDLFDLRLILEVTAAERAARNLSLVNLALLKELSTISYDLDDPKSQTLFLKTNRDFHLVLARAAGNRRLEGMLDELLNEMERLFYLGLRLRDSGAEMKHEHQEVVAALENGDVDRVREAITRQVLTSRDRILEAIMQGDIPAVQVSR